MERSRTYTLKFALIICLIASTIISVTALGLQKQKELNVELDRKKKILNAVGLQQSVEALKDKQAILSLYNESIRGILVDLEGNIVPGRSADSLKEDEEGTLLSVYLLVQNKSVGAIAIPVSGKGLWSTLYGYLALNEDLNTVRGITFYKHGETPGLGGEIEKPWFQNNFVGKKIFDANQNLISIKVIKGKVDDLISDPEKKTHSVDGISGATITSRGVTNLLAKWLETYEPFLKKAKKQGLNRLI